MWVILRWSSDNVVMGVLGPFASEADADAFGNANLYHGRWSTDEVENPAAFRKPDKVR